MKIAVPVTISNIVNEHFGQSEFYTIFSISDENQIADIKTILSAEGYGCKLDLARDLAADGVTVMLAGGIGAGAINVLNTVGIRVVRGCSGEAFSLVKQFLNGAVTDSGENCHDHGDHLNLGEHHTCHKEKLSDAAN